MRSKLIKMLFLKKLIVFFLHLSAWHFEYLLRRYIRYAEKSSYFNIKILSNPNMSKLDFIH